VLYLAIPAHNEVATIGVLLWRLRTVLAEFPREYEVVVYDDASTDDTAAVAEQYERAMPVSVLRGRSRLGYAGAVDALLRHVATLTRYPRRDAVLLLQGDFTDPPVIVPEFARRFEGGADLVVGERLTVADAPTAVKRLFKYGHWAMRPFVKVSGVADLTASMRLVRISALREAIRVAGSSPLVSGDSWTANADLLLRLAPHARRVESVPMEPTFGVRMRDTRRAAMADTMSALKWAWASRGRRAVVGSSPAETGPDERRPPRQGGKRRDEPELSVERIREKVRERDGSSGIDGEAPDVRRGRRDRGERAERGERTARAERPGRGDRVREAREPRDVREPREPRESRESREPRDVREPREPRESREPREPRESREPRERTRSARAVRTAEGRTGAPREADATRPARKREEPRSPYADPTGSLDDPFAAPVRREAPGANDPGETPSPQAVPPAFGAARPPADATPDETVSDEPAVLRNSDAAGPKAAPQPGGVDEPGNVDGEGDSDSDSDSDRDRDRDRESDGDGETERDADGQPRRKRRRNRRSRRGRRRKNGEVAGEGEEGGNGDEHAPTGEEAGSVNGLESSRSDETVRFSPGDHIDGEPVAPRRQRRHAAPVEGDEAGAHATDGFDEGDDADEGDDEVAGVESMSEGAPRPRRRGRRGRRGGARRSRGRKDGGDGKGSRPPGDDDGGDRAAGGND
jgi:hypothetical protein